MKSYGGNTNGFRVVTIGRWQHKTHGSVDGNIKHMEIWTKRNSNTSKPVRAHPKLQQLHAKIARVVWFSPNKEAYNLGIVQ